MKFFSLILIIVIACSANTSSIVSIEKQRLVVVANSSELKNALAAAQPGDSIVLKEGIYNGKFIIENSGTENKRIVLSGSRNAILDAGSVSSGYALHLKANYWKFLGFTVRNAMKGIMTDGASNNLIQNVFVTQIGDEAIHLRAFSSKNIVRDCDITNTGIERPGYGEGIYIGSAYSNWDKNTQGKPDNSDDNQVLNNRIGPGVTAECIDIKEGTTGGIIRGNKFDATGISGENYADSWIDVKGNNYLIEANVGTNPAGSALVDGYQVNCAYAGWGNNNVFKANLSTVNAAGYGINIRLTSNSGQVIGTVVYDNNTATNAAKGISNITLTSIK